jgi:hypothetical protein
MSDLVLEFIYLLPVFCNPAFGACQPNHLPLRCLRHEWCISSLFFFLLRRTKVLRIFIRRRKKKISVRLVFKIKTDLKAYN